MSIMKKIFISILAIFLSTSLFALPAHASSNTDAIISSLQAGVEVNGTVVSIPASYINQAENYFAAHKITDAQSTYILAQISGAKEAIREAGITDLKHMNEQTKQKIFAAAQASANEIALKMSIGSDKNIKITDNSGSIAFSDENVIKTTGPSVNWHLWEWVWGVAFASVIGFCLFVVRKYKLLEKEDL